MTWMQSHFTTMTKKVIMPILVPIYQKLDMVLATFTSMTETSIKADLAIDWDFKTPVSDNSTLLLERVLYIYYPLYFRKNQRKIQTLINSDNEVNAIISAYTKRLSFQTQKTDVSA